MPPVSWAQRKDTIFVTLGIADCTETKIDLTDEKLEFRCGNHERDSDSWHRRVPFPEQPIPG